MSELLEQGIDAVRSLPVDRQDAAGELLLNIAAPQDSERYSLAATQLADIQQAVFEVDRGELASDQDLEGLWRNCGV